MQPREAQAILDTLARGFDPQTGEALDAEGPLRNPQVIRALYVAALALAEVPAPQPARATREWPAHVGKAWTAEEEAQLCADFDSGLSVAELAGRHQRTRGGIRSRLVQLGRIERGAAQAAAVAAEPNERAATTPAA